MNKDDYVFLPRYKNRRTAMDQMGRMFGVLLKQLGMETDKDGNKLTSYSLRHSAITFNLSVKEVDSLDIARRADTSMKMIDQYYYPRIAQDEKLKDFLRV
jgi:integrase